jgi:hypothetical protein
MIKFLMFVILFQPPTGRLRGRRHRWAFSTCAVAQWIIPKPPHFGNLDIVIMHLKSLSPELMAGLALPPLRMRGG